MSFEIEINGERKVQIESEELSNYDIQDLADESVSLRMKNRNYMCTFLPSEDPKNQVILVNNTKYEIKIEDNLDQLISKLGFNEVKKEDASDIFSPMPGLVLDILVSENEEIEKGQALVILEAMKMENIIKAQGTGKIQAIKISKGDKVEKSQLLISIEAQ